MFWLLTQSGQFLTDVVAAAMNVELVSSYTLQNVRTTFSFLEGLKISPARSTLKFLFTNENLPARVSRVNSVYTYIRSVVTTISKPIKSIVVSKKMSVAVSAFTTAASLSGTGAAMPIMLVGAGLAAWSSYSGETRRQAMTEEILELDNAYNMHLTQVIANGRDIKLYDYKMPGPTEVIKMGLDIVLAGVSTGLQSFRSISTIATYAYYAYSEYNINKAMKEKKASWAQRTKAIRDGRGFE